MKHCYVTCYITTLTLILSCSYPQGRRRMKTVPRPRAMGSVSLQGSGYYICCCICCCAAGTTCQPSSQLHALDNPRARQVQQPKSGLSPCCSPRAAVAADSHFHLRLHCLVAAAALHRLHSVPSRQAVIRTWSEDSCTNTGS